ncbi:MAG: heavy metal translocating P-type ATPase [Ignavibacteriae bacterium HGW-Ignavibacteriae-4]|jgi:Cu+-exporting ATPase|nr:MAG: heavy metal translocating P-type ATPase [Ignavibacteriae bacterium HGW-Ignavibacteriae-4]
MSEKLICKHCSSECPDDTISLGENVFCCNGCKTVYEILQDNNLAGFYNMEDGSGALRPDSIDTDEFAFLDNAEITEKLKTYSINGKSKVIFNLPQIHCSACIWLLENLPKLKDGILKSEVNFPNKEIDVIYDETVISIRSVVELLAALGYRPKLDLTSMEGNKSKSPNRSLYIKLGVAGFSFGNLMMLAFPEYLSGGEAIEPAIKELINWLNILFIIPLLYAGSDYLKSAYYGLKTKIFNIDIPISIGIIVLAVRSTVDIVTNSGHGYVDSLGGLLFFLLIGKLFQQKTYNLLSFDRDYKSYFPLSVIRKTNNENEHITLKDIKIGDVLLIRNNEIIPTDSLLESEKAMMDYSFVTGESSPVSITHHEKIYAGGRALGKAIEVLVTEEFDQSYLTKLWNNDAFEKFSKKGISKMSNMIARNFSIVVMIIGIAAFAFWLPHSTAKAFDVLTAILIIACPCALALTLPFTYGSTMRVFGRNRFFIKTDGIVEFLSNIDSFVFDKTGTLTKATDGGIIYKGKDFEKYKSIVKAAVSNSTHPISSLINSSISGSSNEEIGSFEELTGKGIIATHKDITIRIGSAKWIEPKSGTQAENAAVLEINGEVYGAFYNRSEFRDNAFETLEELSKNGYDISIISGDNQKDENNILAKAPKGTKTHFNKLPHEKLDYIAELQGNGANTAMVGDGLNDAGALAKANVGIAIAEKSNNFTPGSDAILLGDELDKLPKFMQMSKSAIKIAYASIGISFIYNTVGISFAASGHLSPVVAAILMPISSISVIVFTVSAVNLIAKRKGL